MSSSISSSPSWYDPTCLLIRYLRIRRGYLISGFRESLSLIISQTLRTFWGFRWTFSYFIAFLKMLSQISVYDTDGLGAKEFYLCEYLCRKTVKQRNVPRMYTSWTNTFFFGRPKRDLHVGGINISQRCYRVLKVRGLVRDSVSPKGNQSTSQFACISFILFTRVEPH